jgi:hypothetical protein
MGCRLRDQAWALGLVIIQKPWEKVVQGFRPTVPLL